MQPRRQVVVDPGEDDLGLGVAEPDVVLEHTHPVGREHQPGIQDPPEIDTPRPEGLEGRPDGTLHHLGHGVVPAGDRRIGAHPPRVGAGVAVADPLEVPGRGQRHRPPAVAHGQHAELRTGEPLLDDDPPARLAEGGPVQLGAHVGDGFVAVGGHQHPLAGRQPVGLHHPRTGQGVEEPQRAGEVVGAERGMTGGRHAGGDEDLLHPRLRSLQSGPVGPRPEHHPPGGPQAVGDTVDERGLRADHVQVGVDRLGRAGHARRHGGDARVARRAHHLGGAGQNVGEGVLTRPAPDDADPHAERATTWSRPGPRPTRRIGTPMCVERKST